MSALDLSNLLNKLREIPCRVAQSVTCLAIDACLTADPGVASSILVWSGPILLWRLIMKKFLRSFSSFR